MEYLQTLCFAGINSKRENFSKKEKKKRNCSSLSHDKALCVATNVQAIGRRSYVATKDSMLQQKMGKI